MSGGGGLLPSTVWLVILSYLVLELSHEHLNWCNYLGNYVHWICNDEPLCKILLQQRWGKVAQWAANLQVWVVCGKQRCLADINYLMDDSLLFNDLANPREFQFSGLRITIWDQVGPTRIPQKRGAPLGAEGSECINKMRPEKKEFQRSKVQVAIFFGSSTWRPNQLENIQKSLLVKP